MLCAETASANVAPRSSNKNVRAIMLLVAHSRALWAAFLQMARVDPTSHFGPVKNRTEVPEQELLGQAAGKVVAAGSELVAL